MATFHHGIRGEIIMDGLRGSTIKVSVRRTTSGNRHGIEVPFSILSLSHFSCDRARYSFWQRNQYLRFPPTYITSRPIVSQAGHFTERLKELGRWLWHEDSSNLAMSEDLYTNSTWVGSGPEHSVFAVGGWGTKTTRRDPLSLLMLHQTNLMATLN
jgi:hypothetical protein